MCTAIRYNNYFGRNFDLEREYERNVLFVPRNAPLKFRHRKRIERHYAFMGMGTGIERFPLCYDGINEKGLACAALNFPHYAKYFEPDPAKKNLASFELIPFILAKFKNVKALCEELRMLNITGADFSRELAASPLHWIVADRYEAAVIESTKAGLKIYRGSAANVLANSPSFDIQLTGLDSTLRNVRNSGLPGDYSSISRFVKSSFLLRNSPVNGENECAHLFRLLYAVALPKGGVKVDKEYKYTQYTACMDLCRGEYYFTTYNDLAPRRVSFKNCELEYDCPKFVL